MVVAAGVSSELVGPMMSTDGASAPRIMLLIISIGGQSFALLGSHVERLLRMVAITPFPEGGPGVAGVVDFHGTLLPVVDPRVRLGLPAVAPHSDQRLVVLSVPARYILWVDTVTQVENLPAQVVNAEGRVGEALTNGMANVGGELIPVLSSHALYPGALIASAVRDS
ncbi:MAG: purine-binding chemotaxis protein CheW [Chloroflexota bacterium]|nr:purine-binding chemotaxis protein CheW [Chloroflexota bacterium]